MKDRARRRGRRRDRRSSAPHESVQQVVNQLPLVTVLSDEAVHTIHKASMRLLKEHGVLVLDYPAACETFRDHGARVEGDLVRIDEDTLMPFVRQAPALFTQLARNQENKVEIGGRGMVFAPVYGPPFVSDLEGGRRQARLEDFHNFVRMAYMSPHMHHSGGTVVEPNDVDVRERHIDMLLAHITLSDKAFMGSVTHADNARDTLTMARILFGSESLEESPAVISLINASSPLRFDNRMLGALEVYARARQAVIVTPFIIAGAMSPTSVAATLAQQNAEALFGICYAQMLNPGTPCVYGSFLANIDMKSGAPCFGTGENTLALCAGAQMARYYELPYRSGGNLTAARSPGAQAGYESAATMLPTVQAGTNFVLHAAGWLEGGLISSYEKFILDTEMCGMLARMAGGIGMSEEDFAWDAFEEVGPGNHFLGSQHTMRHYTTAFYQHTVFSMDNYELWEEKGRPDSYQLANARWKQMLSSYQKPALDDAIEEQLLAFSSQRRDQIRAGVPRTEWHL